MNSYKYNQGTLYSGSVFTDNTSVKCPNACMYMITNELIHGFFYHSKKIPSKHKSSSISLFKIHISFSAGVKEKNFWFLGLLPLKAIFIVMFWTNKQKLLFIFNRLHISLRTHWEQILTSEGNPTYLSIAVYVYEFNCVHVHLSEFAHLSKCVHVSEFIQSCIWVFRRIWVCTCVWVCRCVRVLF